MANYALFIGETTNKGRGMFTKEAINAGAVIETAPVIVMSAEDRKLIDQTLLHDYIFEWEPNGEHLCCMALGCVPIYNHSYGSNCEYFMNYEDKMIYVQTVRDIKPGEELTINYNGDWNDGATIWFEAEP